MVYVIRRGVHDLYHVDRGPWYWGTVRTVVALLVLLEVPMVFAYLGMFLAGLIPSIDEWISMVSVYERKEMAWIDKRLDKSWVVHYRARVYSLMKDHNNGIRQCFPTTPVRKMIDQRVAAYGIRSEWHKRCTGWYYRVHDFLGYHPEDRLEVMEVLPNLLDNTLNVAGYGRYESVEDAVRWLDGSQQKLLNKLAGFRALGDDYDSSGKDKEESEHALVPHVSEETKEPIGRRPSFCNRRVLTGLEKPSWQLQW